MHIPNLKKLRASMAHAPKLDMAKWCFNEDGYPPSNIGGHAFKLHNPKLYMHAMYCYWNPTADDAMHITDEVFLMTHHYAHTFLGYTIGDATEDDIIASYPIYNRSPLTQHTDVLYMLDMCIQDGVSHTWGDSFSAQNHALWDTIREEQQKENSHEDE